MKPKKLPVPQMHLLSLPFVPDARAGDADGRFPCLCVPWASIPHGSMVLQLKCIRTYGQGVPQQQDPRFAMVVVVVVGVGEERHT